MTSALLAVFQTLNVVQFLVEPSEEFYRVLRKPTESAFNSCSMESIGVKDRSVEVSNVILFLWRYSERYLFHIYYELYNGDKLNV